MAQPGSIGTNFSFVRCRNSFSGNRGDMLLRARMRHHASRHSPLFAIIWPIHWQWSSWRADSDARQQSGPSRRPGEIGHDPEAHASGSHIIDQI
jgi:hypothetical protein